MNFKLIHCLMPVASVTLFASVGHAQPVFATYESLELRAARAQTIVRGTVANSEGVFIERKGGYSGGRGEDGRARPDGLMRYTFTVKVDEVLKGKSAKSFELVQETMAGDKRLEQWAEEHTSFLFFDEGEARLHRTWSNLQGLDARSNMWNTIRLGVPVSEESGWSSDSPLYSQDFTRVTDPKDIPARVRKAAKDRSGPAQVHTFKSIWPPDPVHLWASLTVPVNASLEKLARRMIQSPDDFLAKKPSWTPTNAEQRVAFQNGIEGSRNTCRAEGINALGYFKSRRNVKLVQPFLDSPVYLVTQYPDGATAREYYVRKAAFDTLRRWDVDVRQPVIEEKIAAPEPTSRLKFVSVDSQETNGENGRGENAVDGNPATIWQTQWQAASPAPPHEIVLELVPPAVIRGFTYLPRQDPSDHGAIKEYEFYVSNDGDDFGRPVQKGVIEAGKARFTSTFEPVKCRFIKLRAITEINGLAWTSAAEIGVIEAAADALLTQPSAAQRNRLRDPSETHPGDIGPMQSALAGLTTLVPELRVTNFPTPAFDGPNSIAGTYKTRAGSEVTIIAKAYDSAEAAEAGQEWDARMVSVYYDHTESVSGVNVYEYRRYGGLYFQVGQYTFRISTLRRADEDLQPLLLKISLVLIDELKSPARLEPSRPANESDTRSSGQCATFTP